MVYKVRMWEPGLKLGVIYAVVAVTGSQSRAREHEVATKLALTTPTPADLGLNEKSPVFLGYTLGIVPCRIIKNEKVNDITESRVIRWIK